MIAAPQSSSTNALEREMFSKSGGQNNLNAFDGSRSYQNMSSKTPLRSKDQRNTIDYGQND